MFNLPLTFKGIPEKIIIESEDSMFCPPSPGQEIRQRLTMNRNGSVTITRYFSGDYSVVPPTPDTKTMRRYRGKPTEKVMEYLACHFSEDHIGELICDAGIWGVEIMGSDGKKYRYTDSLGNDIDVHGTKMSEIIRRVLEMDDLWLFDGGVR